MAHTPTAQYEHERTTGSPHPLEAPIPWRFGDPYRHPIPNEGDPWEKCDELAQKYDKGMCDAWKEEVDKLLIFAGLFSAAVTAFTIESYQWLQEDPRDAFMQTLTRLTLQLSSEISSVTVPQMVPASIQESPSVPTSLVRINVFWFLSLTLSLGTVVIGISCMQWLREFQRDAALPHQDALALRQMRLKGLVAWHVPSILSSLPIILQTAVVLFFTGLLELLWTLNKMVAGFITVAVGLIILFLIVTTITPFFQYLLLEDKHFLVGQCAYKSPQSWAFYRLGISFLGFVTRTLRPMSRFQRVAPTLLKLRRSLHDRNWTDHDIRQWRRLRDAHDLADALVWIDESFSQSIDVVYSVYHCLLSLQVSTAARIVSHLDPNAANRMHDILENETLQEPSVAEQTKEIILASFLERHKNVHTDLTTSYLESIIRILNIQDFQSFTEWPVSNILELPADIIEQFLLCIKLLIASERVTAPQVTTIWALIQKILQKPTKTRIEPNPLHIRLGFTVIGELECWLTRRSEMMERRDRVALCVYGMISTFNPTKNPLFWWADYPEGVSLVRVLDRYLIEFDGEGDFLVDSQAVVHQWGALVAASGGLPRPLTSQ